MLSFKDGKAMKPLYDYYVETDLDTIDDQPIDYSKRYDDQLADDVCGSSSTKKRHLSTPSENVVPNKIPGDELKVYCIEGTPLLISSASSLCDLHEIGALLQASENEPLKEHAGLSQRSPAFPKKPCFQEPYSNPNEETSLNTKCDESLEDSKFEPDQSESKEGITQENTSSRTDETFSKASSPLMFSRSSSICSLNSFEQHSIVDDRSSVSMFSNLASGIISPSEIPDSPGEAMSPFIHKRHSEFVFPPNDHQPKSLDPVLAKLKSQSATPFNDQAFEDIPEDHLKVYNHESRSQPQDLQRSFNDEAFEDIPEDNLKVYNDEGDCCSVSNLSALSIQASSLSRVSVAVFHKSSFPVVEHKSSIRISCSIVTGNAELQSIAEDTGALKVEPAKTHIKSFSSYAVSESMDVDDNQECVKSFSNYAATGSGMMDLDEGKDHVKSFNGYTGSELMDEDEDLDEKINFSCLAEDEDDCKDGGDSPVGNFSFEDGFEPCLGSFQKPVKENFLPENESPDYSKGNSDDECDALLEECIKSGMPTSNDSLHPHTKQPPNDSCLSDQQLEPKEEILDQNISHSDCDTSDSEEEDLLLQSCIQLGMPQKAANKDPIASNDSNNHLRPSNSLTKSPQSFAKEMDITEVSDDEEYDPLLQQIIQLGKPTNEPKESCNKNANSAYAPVRLDLGYRDNRPDGTSDEEDDDDDILTECIQAGMPKPKIEQSKSPYALSTKAPGAKPHPHRLSPASEDRAAYLSSFAGPHQPCRKSPTSEYRTAHPKPNQQRNSPTKEDRAMPLPSYTRQHQRQPHRRSPTAEDRAMLLFSLGGQHVQYPRKSPSRMLLPSNVGHRRKSPAAPDRTLVFNSANQPRQMSPAALDRMSSNFSNQSRQMFSPAAPDRTLIFNSANQPRQMSPAAQERMLSSNFSNQPRQMLSPANPDRTTSSNSVNQLRQMSSAGDGFQKKYQDWMHDFRDSKIEPALIPDATCTYRTEDTPILSPSASVSDLSTLSFSEDRMYLDCSLNNSRNSNCSSESEEDELLLQCIRSGMPSEKRALA